jgi:hypothetical protein
MNWGKNKLVRLVGVALLSIICAVNAQPAYAQPSVTVPGQVPVEQCPIGYQYQTGIEVRIGTGTFTICYAPPTAEELEAREQEREFQARIQVAQDRALEESRAFNAANPGMQRCVQWGPVIHANGVSTSSGGVCANPVEATAPTITQPAPPVVDETVLPTPTTPPATNQPFYVFVDGQVAASACPVGYQGANGIVVNVTTHQVQTQCWSSEAWSAWRLGGDVWQQFENSGGAYNIQAELNRREAVSGLKARALASAQQAANQTPGVRRCSEWSGYGESGSECSYAFIAPSQNPVEPVISETQGPVTVVPQTVKVLAAVHQVTKSTKLSKILLPASKQISVVYKSTTPKICTIVKSEVRRQSVGTCKISVKISDGSGLTTTAVKKITFKR